MIRRLPIISPCAGRADILRALRRAPGKRSLTLFAEALASSMRPRRVFLTNSGISSFYAILKALKNISVGSEVVLPAYTAGSLIVAVRKAGLKPVLCDISLEDLGLDENFLKGTISSRTLAVVAVHIFGINMKGTAGLKAKMPRGVFLIEDCAQSMGSRTLDRESGTFGDVSFFSFNRGKNLPLYGGGAIATDNDAIAHSVEKELAGLNGGGIFSSVKDLLKISAFSIAGNPVIYGLGFPVISRFKEVSPPGDFALKEMGALQAGLGIELMKSREKFFSARHKNGIALMAGLKGSGKVILPNIPELTRYVFNRFPVVFKDVGVRIRAEEGLTAAGIETSRMYLRPLHHMFDLGYAPEDFPNAVYLAQNLLTLPSHPSVGKADIDKMIDAIKQASL
jgi:perosamine synthetase